eukprot:jgi/Psemu1/14638/gm1.14638_g
MNRFPLLLRCHLPRPGKHKPRSAQQQLLRQHTGRRKRRLSTTAIPSVSSSAVACDGNKRVEAFCGGFRSNGSRSRSPRSHPARIFHCRSYSRSHFARLSSNNSDEHGTGGGALRIDYDTDTNTNTNTDTDSRREETDPEWKRDWQRLNELLGEPPDISSNKNKNKNTNANANVNVNPFRHREYQNVWTRSRTAAANSNNYNGDRDREESGASASASTSTELVPLEFRPKLDRQSRFLLQLLQNLYQVGLTHTVDRVTTERCNALLEQLANATALGDGEEEDHNDNGNGNNNNNNSFSPRLDHWQRVERARAILEGMELFVPLLRNHGSAIPTELPVPSYDSYSHVLKLYGSIPGGSDRETQRDANGQQPRLPWLEAAHPLRARAIAERLDNLDFFRSLVGRPSTSWHWNQVLACHAAAGPRANRPVATATLLYELANANANSTANSTASSNANANGTANSNSRSNSTARHRKTDAISFAHALRSCQDESALEDYHYYDYYDEAQNASGESGTARPNEAKEREDFVRLALAVAKRVWKGLVKEQQQQRQQQHSKGSINNQHRRDHLSGLLDEPGSGTHGTHGTQQSFLLINSFHCLHMLRVGRNFATLRALAKDDDTIGDRHHEWMKEAWNACIEHQVVNVHVLQEVMYQGAVLFGEDENDRNSNESSSSSAGGDAALDWVRAIVWSPKSSSSSSSSLPTADWETQVLPRLTAVRDKHQHQQQTQHNPRGKRTPESIYASTIQQTRELMRFLPSGWRIRAD